MVLNQQIGPYDIRPMQIGDLPAVLIIEQQAKPTPWTEQSYRQELANHNSYPIVILKENQILGYIVWWLIADEIQIQTIAVDPAWRGRKLGQWLLHTALQTGLDQGAILSTLEVRESNIIAQRLYEKYRYEIVGRRKNYYRDGETALLMTADFTAVIPSYKAQLCQIWQTLHTTLTDKI